MGPGPTHIGGDAAPALDSLRRKQELIAATILLVKDPQQYAFVNIPHPNWWPYWNERWEPNDPNSPTVADSVLRFVRWPLQLGEPIEGPDTIGITEWQHKRCFEYGTLWVGYRYDSVVIYQYIPSFRVQIRSDSLFLWNTTQTHPLDTVTQIFVDFGDGTHTGWIQVPVIEPIVHQYASPGTYTVTLSTRDVFDCVRTVSKEVEIANVTDIRGESHSHQRPFRVRSFPEEGRIHIQFPEHAFDGTIRIYNLLGKLVYVHDHGSYPDLTSIDIDSASWPKGLYIAIYIDRVGNIFAEKILQ